MQLAVPLLLLIAVHVAVRVDSVPRLQHPHQAGPDTGAPAPAAPKHSQLKGSVRRRDMLLMLPVTTAKRSFVSIFDLRRKLFFCIDVNGILYKSRHKDREGCLFQHIWLYLVKHNVFSSKDGKWLVKLVQGGLRVVTRGPPKVSPLVLKRILYPFLKRQRRSEEVNPSDPLRSESLPSHPAREAVPQLEPEKTGAESKETITSCHDPLWVLRSNGHSSPVKENIAERAEHQ